MVLVEKHIIKPKHKYYDELDNLCWLSKNLYNSTLYNVRQYYFENKKIEIRYYPISIQSSYLNILKSILSLNLGNN